MHTLQPTVAVVNRVAPIAHPPVALMPTDFAAAIAEVEALPQTLADVTDAYNVGVDDAEHGRRCDPLNHYARLGDIEQYIWGWKDATAALHDELEATIDSLFAPARYEPLDADEQGRYDAELEDYLDYLADQQWHASGQW